MNCEVVRRHVDALVDGELDATTQVDFEAHLGDCEPCRERWAFERSFRAQVREALRPVRAPERLRERLRAQLEAGELDARPASTRSRSVRALRVAVPVAIAAAATLAYFGRDLWPGSLQQASAVPLLEDVVRLHASALPADVQDAQPAMLRSYFRGKVEFPVRPAVFDRPGAKLLGARLSNVRERRAAALYYDVDGRRVTMVMFHEPADEAADAAAETTETHVVDRSGRRLHYRQVGGYAVPVFHRDGVTYAMTGDLDRDSLLRLAASARVPE